MSGIFYSPGMTLDLLERQVIEYAYKFFGFNKAMTAQSLGITPKTIENKLARYADEDEFTKEAQAAEKRRREDFIARSRGIPNGTSVAQASPSVVAEDAVAKSPKEAMRKRGHG